MSNRRSPLRILYVLMAVLLSFGATRAADVRAAPFTLHMVYFSGPESDAMAQVIAYWNSHRATQAGFQVQMDLSGV